MNVNAPNQDRSDYLTPTEASHATGLTVRQLSRLADAGRIRAIRPGKHRRYLTADVAAIIAGEPWDAA